MFTFDLTDFKKPIEGVKPPSFNAEQSSIRLAPPSMAASIDCHESTQISNIIWLLFLRFQIFFVYKNLHENAAMWSRYFYSLLFSGCRVIEFSGFHTFWLPAGSRVPDLDAGVTQPGHLEKFTSPT